MVTEYALARHGHSAVRARRGLSLLPLALLRPFLGDALDGADDGWRFHELHHHRGLAAVEIFDARAGDVQDEDHRLVAGDACCRCRMVSRLCPKAPSWRNGLRCPATSYAGHQPRRSSGSAFIAKPTEGGLDHERDALVVIILDLAIVEALHLASGCAEALPRSGRGR